MLYYGNVPCAQARQLKYLNVSHNALTSLASVGNLTQLRVLKCAHNQLEDLAWLPSLAQLEEFCINNNRVAETQLGHVAKLKRLQVLVVHPNPCTKASDYA